MSETAKTCTGCEQTKPLNQFTPSKTGRLGVLARCKACRSAKQRAADPTAKRAAEQRWRAANPEANRASGRERGRRWRQRHPEQAAHVSREASRTRRSQRTGGAFGTVRWAAVRAKTDTCYLCGLTLSDAPIGDDVHPDHVVPLARGGAHSVANLLPVHADCNWRKSNQMLAELPWFTGPVLLGAWTVRPVGCVRQS